MDKMEKLGQAQVALESNLPLDNSEKQDARYARFILIVMMAFAVAIVLGTAFAIYVAGR